MIAETAIIHPSVQLGADCVIEDFVIIGCPPKGWRSGDKETIIGANAIIRSHTVIYAGNKIGDGFHAGHKANIREFNQIGDRVSLGTLSVVEHHVEIGDGVRIHTQAFIPEYTILEAGCWIGPNVVLTNAKYPNALATKEQLAGVTVKRHAIIGANSTILPGLTIGEHALIGAGSVVTRDVEARSVVGGNPCRTIRSRIDEIDCYRNMRIHD